MKAEPEAISDVIGARPLAMLGDSITTDHISRPGSIKKESPAGDYLLEHQVRPLDFNSYGSRRGNHDVMIRGTFANIRIKNELVPGVAGRVTRHLHDGQEMQSYSSALQHEAEGVHRVSIRREVSSNEP